ncbi:MAG: tail fiber domain-containing protein [Thermoanaerobaculia bacterium]|nr:tail fiber domain-containing protein [Thermoanaerobaculia bacterium]
MIKLKRFLTMMAVLGLGTSPLLAGERATVKAAAASLDFQTAGDHGKTVLVVQGPGGLERYEFAAGAAPSLSLFDGKGGLRPDGQYRWELVAEPRTGTIVRGESDTEAPRADGGFVQSGTFAIRGGSFDVGGGLDEARGLESAPLASKVIVDRDGVAPNDQVIPDDLVVQGSGCFGFDCVNNESFGFDTLRLKENNLRIKFEDTSVGAFPSNDWQLTANDSASGGANKFSIEDITGARVPFTVTAGAATNSIFVDSTGRVGLRTSTPVLDLHIATSNTPALRLEQNSSGGFTAQTWDIAGNEANFFVRDVTGGSRLPFRIRPGAPTSSVDISSDGDVGIGTASPSQKLHVLGSGGTTQYLVEETNGTVANRVLMSLKNNGPVSTEFVNANAGGITWRINNLVAGLAFNNINSPAADNEALLTPTGSLTILGTLTQGSDRTRKSNIVEVDSSDVLARVRRLPVATWSWQNEEGVRHLGPMAQDFKAAFGLGETDTGIAPLDMAGVSLAAVKALAQDLESKNAEIEALKAQNAELAARLAAIEAALAKRD